jgi:hypothetical protein
MSIDIFVIRGAGDKRGPDVEDALLCSIDAAVERGRFECDNNSGLQPIDISCVLNMSLTVGDLVRIEDSLYGVSWAGKITSVRHSVSITPPSALTYVTLVRTAQ